MKRFRDDAPADICFARGTFNSHPYVMGSMNVFLNRIEQAEFSKNFQQVDDEWNQRAIYTNERLSKENIPLKIVNMSSVWVPLYTRPSRYNWMLQYYLRAEGLVLPWIGTGRFIFSHTYTDEEFRLVVDKIVNACLKMKADGWWWKSPTLNNKSIKKKVGKELFKGLLTRYRKRLGLSKNHFNIYD